MFYHAACCCGAAPQDWLIVGGDASGSNHWLRLDPSDLSTITQSFSLSDGDIEDVDYGPDLAAYTLGSGSGGILRRSLVATLYNKSAVTTELAKVNSSNEVYVKTSSTTVKSYDSTGTQVNSKTWTNHAVAALRICSDDDVMVLLEDQTSGSDGVIKRVSTDMATERWSTTFTTDWNEGVLDIDEDDHAYVFWSNSSGTVQAKINKFHENTGVQQWSVNVGPSGSGTANNINAVAARNGSVYCHQGNAKIARHLTSTGANQWTTSTSYTSGITAGRSGECYCHNGASSQLFKLKVSDGTEEASATHSGEDFETLWMVFG